MKTVNLPRTYIGYLRTEESVNPKLMAVFVYARKEKKYGVTRKVKVTISEIK